MERETAPGSNDRANAVLASHTEAVAEALASGDAAAIKQLYVDLGADMGELDADDAPLLSLPETSSSVVELLAGSTGPHLDVGCGPNPLASLLVAADGRLVVGVDIGTGMVSLASRVAEKAGVDFLGVVADAEKLPFRDGVFGSVVCDDTIEHLPDHDAGARELARVTRDGGRIALATPNRVRLPVLAKRLRDRLRGRRKPASAYYAASSHLREYTWRDLERVVEPYHQVLKRGHVRFAGWKGAKVASALTRLPGGQQAGRVILLLLTPRRPDTDA